MLELKLKGSESVLNDSEVETGAADVIVDEGLNSLNYPDGVKGLKNTH